LVCHPDHPEASLRLDSLALARLRCGRTFTYVTAWGAAAAPPFPQPGSVGARARRRAGARREIPVTNQDPDPGNQNELLSIFRA